MNRAEAISSIIMNGGGYVAWRPVGGVGDAVMMIPSLVALKKQAGNDLVIVSCVDYIAPIFDMCPYVDAILSYTSDEIKDELDKSDLDLLDEHGSVIYKFYDPCPASLYESENHPFALIKSLNRALPTGNVISKSRQEIFCEHVGVEFSMDNYCLDVNGDYSDSIDKLGRYIVYQPFTNEPRRNYPYYDMLFRKLVRLGEKIDFNVVSIDSSKWINIKGVHNVVGSSLKYVAALLKSAAAFIGCDSMGAHLAGALETETFGIFGPTDPSVRLKYKRVHWNPRLSIAGRNCPRQYCWYLPCKKRFCLRSSRCSPSAILDQFKEALE